MMGSVHHGFVMGTPTFPIVSYGRHPQQTMATWIWEFRNDGIH
jgi:hypothetical protein